MTYKLNKEVKLKKNFVYLEKLCLTKNKHIERDIKKMLSDKELHYF